MIKWEIKKILKEKTNLIGLGLIVILFLQIGFMKPMLETQNEYYDEAKNEYFIDKRKPEVIGNEKLQNKVNGIKQVFNDTSSDKSSKQLRLISVEKLKDDKGEKYENIDFYKVFSERSDYSLSILIMMMIIILIASNLYTDERLSNVSPIILSSKNKNKVIYSKLGVGILLPILLYALYLVGTFAVTYIQYGTPLHGNLQAYRISDIAMSIKVMTINQYVLSKILTTTLMLSGVSLMSLLSSFVTYNSVSAIGLSVGFIAIGKIVTLFKFLPKTLLALAGIGNYVDVTMGMSKISGFYNGSVDILSRSFDLSNLCIAIYGLIVVIAITINIYVIKKFLSK